MILKTQKRVLQVSFWEDKSSYTKRHMCNLHSLKKALSSYTKLLQPHDKTIDRVDELKKALTFLFVED